MTRAQEFAATFVKEIDAVIKTVEGLTDEQWRLKTASEGWPVCVLAYHIAARTGMPGLEGIISGKPTLIFEDLNELDARNARDARMFANCTKVETLDLLRDTSSRIGQYIAELTDDQLKIRGDLHVIGAAATAQQWIPLMMINHVPVHHESILQTVSQTTKV